MHRAARSSSSPVANDGNAELPGSSEDSVLLNIERPRRVLDLDSGDRSSSGSTSEGLRSALRDTNVLEVTFVTQRLQVGHDLLDGPSGVDSGRLEEVHLAMLEQAVDVLAALAEILETRVGFPLGSETSLDREEDLPTL